MAAAMQPVHERSWGGGAASESGDGGEDAGGD